MSENDLFKGIKDSQDALMRESQERILEGSSRVPREAEVERTAERTEEVRDFTYRPPTDLEISEKVRSRFLNKGMKLRWIRYKIQGELDQNNIFRHMKEHASFVKPEEVPEMINTVEIINTGKVENMVTIGDLALVKIPVEAAEARREYYQSQTANQLGAIKRDLMKHDTKVMPMYDDSRSSTKTGKNAHFASD